MGLRPEAFEDVELVDEDQRAAGVVTDIDVEVLESMGSDKYAHFTAPDIGDGGDVASSEAAVDAGLDESSTGSMVARLSAESAARRGERVSLWFDPAKVSIFDAETGENLGL